MKKRYLTILPAVAMMAPMQASAEIEIHPNLLEVSKKVDTDGDFFQINRFDGDMKVMVEYGDLALDIAKKKSKDIPRKLTVSQILEILGLDHLKASAVSSKKVGNAWNNRSYLFTGGSNDGLLSLVGSKSSSFGITQFAPAGSDLVADVRLDLRQMEAMMLALAKVAGKEADFTKEMKKPHPTHGITPSDVLAKVNMRASIAIDIDPANRKKMGPGMDLPGAEMIARIENAAWLWPLIGDEILKESKMPWKKSVSGTETTYSLPAEFADKAMGYSPVIVIDNKRKFIWVASKASVLKKARSSAPKLKDDKEFKKTMATLPKKGNALVYLSEELLAELATQYKLADQNGLLNDDDFQTMKPVVDVLVKDLLKTEAGAAVVVAKDAKGIHSVIRAPFATKNYLDQITPVLGPLFLAGYQTTSKRVMIENEVMEIEEARKRAR